MTAVELRSVIAEMGRSRDRLPDVAMAGKVRALWISGWHLGVVRDRTDAGLAAWLRRQTGLDAASWDETGRHGAGRPGAEGVARARGRRRLAAAPGDRTRRP